MPLQVSPALPNPIIFRLAGTVSLNAIPFNVVAVFGLVMVNVMLVVPFSGMLAAPNALLMVGGATTVREVLEVLPVPATVSLTVTLLGAAPATVPFTFTEIMHDAPAAKLAPVKETTPEPATTAGAVLQVLVKPLGVATTRVPGAAFGKVSVNEIPFRTEAPNTLLMVGGLMTVRLAEEVD